MEARFWGRFNVLGTALEITLMQKSNDCWRGAYLSCLGIALSPACTSCTSTAPDLANDFDGGLGNRLARNRSAGETSTVQERHGEADHVSCR